MKNYYLGCIGKIKSCDLVKIIDVLYFGALWKKTIIYIIPELAGYRQLNKIALISDCIKSEKTYTYLGVEPTNSLLYIVVSIETHQIKHWISSFCNNSID